MRSMLINSWPLLLLLSAIPLLVLTGPAVMRGSALSSRQAKFRSIRVTSPVLSTLVMISVIGKPFLEHLRKNDWHSDLVGSWLLPLVLFLVVCLYATIGAIILFFFRAIQNINFFNQRKIRAPYSALLMVVPITNLIVIPYVEYFAYHRSKLLVPALRVSALNAALLATSAFGLLLVSISCGLAGEHAPGPALYDETSLLIIGTTTGLASGILVTRIVEGIFRAQDAYARQIGAVPNSRGTAAPAQANPMLEALKSICVVALVAVALIAALLPSLASDALRSLIQFLPSS